jgi:hypothetical protein
LKIIVVKLVLAPFILLVLACSTSAAPKSCVEVAREKGIPEAVVELMERPHDDLNALERIAIRAALDKVGVGDICDKFRE